MKQKPQRRLPGLMLRLMIFLAVVLGVSKAAASAELTLGDASANSGDTVEVPVMLAGEGVVPAALVVFVAFDPAQLQPAAGYFPVGAGASGFTGAPGTAYGLGAAAPGPAAIAAGKFVDSYAPAEGVLAFSVAGMNLSGIGDGVVAWLALKVMPGLSAGSTAALRGLDADAEPVMIEGKEALSSAAQSDGGALPLTITDGSITVGCAPAPAPSTVNASRNRSDGVLVQWASVPIEGAVYRVFRGETDDPALASAQGAGWTEQAAFLDETAAEPTLVTPGGCFRGAQYNYVNYYYWIKVRGAEHCGGALSQPSAVGARGPDGTPGNSGCNGKAAPDASNVAGFGLSHGAALALALLFGRRPRR